MTEHITLHRFDDLHCHFRTGEILKTVVPLTSVYAGRAVVMPNTRPRAILEAEDVTWYREQILAAIPPDHRDCFHPLMTIEIRKETTPAMVYAAYRAGAVAAKVYPRGVTTNAEHGMEQLLSAQAIDIFRALDELGMLLLIHGEQDEPRLLVTQREEAFLPTLQQLALQLPTLRIVLEHVSTRVGVETVRSLGANVAATITAHHLCLTLNDVIGNGVHPHHACMPTPKGFDDLDALIEAATSGDPKFFLGSDTAPHLREKKECAHGACGVFTAPILPMLLTDIFERANRLDRLDDLVSRYGAEFYRIPRNLRTIVLGKRPWCVPAEYGGIVPFKAGERLSWQLIDSCVC